MYRRADGTGAPTAKRRTLSTLLQRLPRLDDSRPGMSPGPDGRPGLLYDVIVSQDGTDASVEVRASRIFLWSACTFGPLCMPAAPAGASVLAMMQAEMDRMPRAGADGN